MIIIMIDMNADDYRSGVGEEKESNATVLRS